MENDPYQERYLAHQERKKEILESNYGSEDFKIYSKKEQEVIKSVIENRCSQRAFNKEEIDLDTIMWAIEKAPSSCDRKGVQAVPISERDDKDVLSGLLVGGVGWIQRANTILLLKADMDCYKSPAEKDFMPYLDAGVLIQTTYLTCEVMNTGCCFVNPNIRENNKEFFAERFGFRENELFCGALVIGKFNKKHK